MSVKLEQDASVIRLVCFSLFTTGSYQISVHPFIEDIMYTLVCLKKLNPRPTPPLRHDV